MTGQYWSLILNYDQKFIHKSIYKKDITQLDVPFMNAAPLSRFMDHIAISWTDTTGFHEGIVARDPIYMPYKPGGRDNLHPLGIVVDEFLIIFE